MQTLTIIAGVSLVLAGVCSIIILWDVLRYPQQMAVMNIVWPVTALFAGPLALWAYVKIGRKDGMHSPKPFWQSVLVGALHCGSGCTIGDLLAETLVLFVPLKLAGSRLLGTWVADFIFAFLVGILFQYYALKPMKKGSPGETVVAALKADTLSLTFWQLGMYGWMAICFFAIFHRVLHSSEPVFWLMMQVAMIAGFITTYPVNWWLLRKGIKEPM